MKLFQGILLSTALASCGGEVYKNNKSPAKKADSANAAASPDTTLPNRSDVANPPVDKVLRQGSDAKPAGGTPSETPKDPENIVTKVVINDGAASRSRLTEIRLYFGGKWTVDESMLALVRQDAEPKSVGKIKVVLSEDEGSKFTIATLHFEGLYTNSG